MSLNNLLYSEYSDALKRKLTHTRSVAIHITEIYYCLILLCIFCYYLAGITLFDAVCHEMFAVSNGGFANYNDSIGYYNNPIIGGHNNYLYDFMLFTFCELFKNYKTIRRLL
nr:potassium transporter TrkG [Wolbachia endosymbiont of Trichogramma pretiosum]